MRFIPGESYEQWLERACSYEYDKALAEIKKGVPPDKVLEDLSKRLIQKGMYPIFKALRETTTNYDVAKSREEYEKNYIRKRNGPAPADHVTED